MQHYYIRDEERKLLRDMEVIRDRWAQCFAEYLLASARPEHRPRAQGVAHVYTP